MASYETKRCGACCECYDSSDHRPLLLDCVHTSCYLCILNRNTSVGIRCYRCRKLTTKPLDQLPINWELIPSPSSLKDLCLNHGGHLEYLCADCGDLICKQCLKNDHVSHKTDSIKNIAGSGSAAGAWKEVHNKLSAKMDLFTKTLEGPREMLYLITELTRDLEEFQVSLQIELASVKKDLNTWDVLATTSSQEITVREVVQRLKEAELPKCEKLPQIKTNAHALMEKSAEIMERELLPDHGDWKVGSEAASAVALASVEVGRCPNNVTIHSWPSDPIKMLPKLLDVLATACTGDIELYLLDTFWSLKLEADVNLSAVIQKHGNKLTGFCGSTEDAIRVGRARGQSSVRVGVRLAGIKDLRQFSALSVKPYYASCIKGLPLSACDRMQKNGWTPTVWSFPHLSEESLDWMFDILKSFAPQDQPSERSLFLPRCRLTYEDIRKLIVKLIVDYAGSFSYVECDTRISEGNWSVLQSFSKQQGVTFKRVNY